MMAGVSGAAPGVTSGATLKALMYAAKAWGVPVDEGAVERSIEGVAVGSAPGASELAAQLRRGAAVAGFEVRPYTGSTVGLVAAARPGSPAFRLVGGAGGWRWVALLGGQGGRPVLIEMSGQELPGQDASALLGEMSTEGVWFFLEPQRPLEGAAGGHGGHGGHPTPWERLWALLKPEAADLGVVLVYAVLVGMLSLAVPIAVQALVNTVAFGVLRQPVVVLTLLVLGGLGFAGALRAAQVHVVEVLQRRLFVRAAIDAASRLVRAQVAAFDGRSGPELVNRFFEVLTLQKSAASLLLDGLGVVLQVSIGAVLLGFYHPTLLAFDVVLMGAVAFVVVALGRGGLATSVAESQAKYAVVSWLEELAQPHTTFRSAGGSAMASLRMQRLCGDYLQARRGHFRVVMRQTAGTLVLHAVASAALLGVGAVLVMERQLSLGQLVAAELIVSAMLEGISKLGKYLETGYDLLTAADKLGYLIDLPLERSEGEALAGRGPAAVKLQGVSFAHEPPADPHHEGEAHGGHAAPLFHDLSLEVAPGQSVGIVGDGDGLSTLADLVLGYRVPSSGVVCLDRVDLRELRLEGVRSWASLAHGPGLFEGTVADNVRAGREEVGLDEVREAIELVGLTGVIQALPGGVHQRLIARGTPLSRGQAELLGLARAVAGRPRLLILDGTLDRLGEGQQQVLLERLLDPRNPWTLLLLTCDPRLAARCQRPFRLASGHLRALRDDLTEEHR